VKAAAGVAVFPGALQALIRAWKKPASDGAGCGLGLLVRSGSLPEI
jgi:hypothetical protein